MAVRKKKRKTPPPPSPELASNVANRHIDNAIQAAEDMPSLISRLRQFFVELSSPIEVTPDEARSALYVAGLARTTLRPDDPRVARVVGPPKDFTVGEIVNLVGGDSKRPSVRAALQKLRDRDGLVQQNGRGHWQLVDPPEVEWPDTDREAGWVIDKNGNLYAI